MSLEELANAEQDKKLPSSEQQKAGDAVVPELEVKPPEIVAAASVALAKPDELLRGPSTSKRHHTFYVYVYLGILNIIVLYDYNMMNYPNKHLFKLKEDIYDIKTSKMTKI
jgi:hypothetical protein